MAVRQKRKRFEAAIGRIAAASLFALSLGADAQKQRSAPEDVAERADQEKVPHIDEVRDTSLVSTIVLKVIHPAEVTKSIIEAAESLGGFAIFITDERLTLKVPPDKLTGLLEAMRAQGIVVEKTLERQDLTARIAELEGQLKSKTEILRRLREFFRDSHVSAALSVEQSMSALVAELEKVKGELRVAREQARHAVVDISFRFQKRDRVIYVDSPFEWINTVDLDRFLREF